MRMQSFPQAMDQHYWPRVSGLCLCTFKLHAKRTIKVLTSNALWTLNLRDALLAWSVARLDNAAFIHECSEPQENGSLEANKPEKWSGRSTCLRKLLNSLMHQVTCVNIAHHKPPPKISYTLGGSCCLARLEISTDLNFRRHYQSAHAPSVHCASLLDVQRASQNVLSAVTVGSPGKVKVSHAVITWSVSQSVLCPQVLQNLLCVVFCSVSLWIVWDTVKNKEFHLWLPGENKLIPNMQEKISP
jgi:hypothetical protein